MHAVMRIRMLQSIKYIWTLFFSIIISKLLSKYLIKDQNRYDYKVKLGDNSNCQLLKQHIIC